MPDVADVEVLNEEEVKTDAQVLDEEEPEVKVEPEVEDEEEKPEKDKEEKEKDDSPLPFERPSISEIKAKYPELFKEFPTLRDSIFQEIEYRKIFPTIEDARETIEDNIAFNGLRDSVLGGNIEPLLSSVAETDNAALGKLADSFLPTLFKKDQNLYYQVMTPVFEGFVRQMANSRDENERNAAIVVGHFLWGKDGIEVAEGKKTFAKSREITPEEKRIQDERAALERTKYESFKSSVDTDITSGLIRLISRGLDPDGTMTEYAKQTLIKDIFQRIDQALLKDENHVKVVNSHWLRARKRGLNSDSKEKIVAAYLSRAKQIVPSIRDRARNEFLGTRQRSSEKLAEKIPAGGRPVVTGKPGSSREAPQKIDYRKMSDMDILNS